jgi:hypothetical protein
VKAAPAFSAVLLPEPFWRLAVALLVGTTSGVVLAWMQSHGLIAGVLGADPFSAVWMFLVAQTVLALLVAVMAWRRAGLRPCRLVWDGQTWSFGTPDGPLSPCQPSIAFDLGSWLLIRMRPLSTSRWGVFAGGAAQMVWIPASARSAAGLWHPLRVALHMHAQSLARVQARHPGGPGDVGGARAP